MPIKKMFSKDEELRNVALADAQKEQKALEREVQKLREKTAEYSRDIRAGLYDHIMPKDYEY